MYRSTAAVFSAEPEIDPIEQLVGRRSAERVTVDLPAHFRVQGLVCVVLVCDISRTGARLQMSTPPLQGAFAVLTWEGLDCPCHVVWSRADACGIEFISK